MKKIIIAGVALSFILVLVATSGDAQQAVDIIPFGDPINPGGG